MSEEGTRLQARGWATAIVLAWLVGSVVDWLVVLSQFTQRGDITPLLPPMSLVTLVLGLVVSGPAVALTSRSGPKPKSAAGLAFAGLILLTIIAVNVGAATRSADLLFTMSWFTPIVIVVIPIVTWVASRFGESWPRYVVLTVGAFDVATVLLMWFGLPRV